MKKFNEFINESTYVQDLAKVKKIIKSCETEEQLDSASNAVNILKKTWNDEFAEHDIWELDRKIKDKYEEYKKN